MPLYLVGMSFLLQACFTQCIMISKAKHNLESFLDSPGAELGRFL